MQENSPSPSVVVLAGPNGAGKTTGAAKLLRDTLSVSNFVNADIIAQGLSGFSPDSAAVQAGRLMLERIHELAASRMTFAFETTLASRSFAPWLRSLIHDGYCFHLVTLWLPSPEMAIARVAQRVRMGGHFVADDTVRRRYHRGLDNLFAMYMPIATTWVIYDNSAPPASLAVASGGRKAETMIEKAEIWKELKSRHDR